MATIPTHILDDLSTRFVINIPTEDRNDLIRICFQIELSHWFYLDFVCDSDPNLPKLKYKAFSRVLFRHIPFLNQFLPQLDDIITSWREYKCAVPTCGAILLDSTLNRVLLVQGFGAKSWGFPKGKINENESYTSCAAREVREETGFDCESLLDEKNALERTVCETSVRLYVCKDVSTDFAFRPIARHEIKDIKWFDVNELPTRECAHANQFFTVCPFVRPLRKWIAREHHKQTMALEHRFWANAWDNIKFDWDRIWKEINRELKANKYS